MFELMKKLFDLARSPAANIKVHSERRTENCSEIRSIGIVIQSVKIEFLHFVYQTDDHYLGIIHTVEGSAVFQHNDEIRAQIRSLGTLVASIIERELALIVKAAESKVLNAVVKELCEAKAIDSTYPALTEFIADGFIYSITHGNYSSADRFLKESLKVNDE